MTLNKILKVKVKNWRENNYKSDYPAIREGTETIPEIRITNLLNR